MPAFDRLEFVKGPVEVKEKLEKKHASLRTSIEAKDKEIVAGKQALEDWKKACDDIKAKRKDLDAQYRSASAPGDNALESAEQRIKIGEALEALDQGITKPEFSETSARRDLASLKAEADRVELIMRNMDMKVGYKLGLDELQYLGF